MLYMEDYLEMIEHLPQELKDRFTEIRELDLQVQNATDKLDERVKLFFSNAKKMKLGDKEVEFEAIRKEYYKTLEDADEKVHQANQMYDLVDRYLRKLDQELHKFKMELEADNAGITEVLEKRSLDLDQKDREKENYSSQKENRLLLNNQLSGGLANISNTASTSTAAIAAQQAQALQLQQQAQLLAIKSEKKSERKSSMDKNAGSGYNLGHIGVGSTAIAAAASQAIAATQQMQQGRRTASLKASYDAIHSGVHSQEFSVGRELLANADISNAAQQALAATAGTSSSSVEQKRNKRKSQHTTQNQQELMPQLPEEIEEPLAVETAADNPDWTYDPSEPRYCTCNQVSYGDMVACDNEDCPIEWFHYPCVGITSTPKGKWYCPQCAAAMKRRGRR